VCTERLLNLLFQATVVCTVIINFSTNECGVSFTSQSVCHGKLCKVWLYHSARVSNTRSVLQYKLEVCTVEAGACQTLIEESSSRVGSGQLHKDEAQDGLAWGRAAVSRRRGVNEWLLSSSLTGKRLDVCLHIYIYIYTHTVYKDLFCVLIFSSFFLTWEKGIS